MERPEGTSGTLGTWQRYKLGQKQWTKWLAQTADKIRRGDGSSTEPASATVQVPPNAASTTATMHWSQLEPLAQFVIENLAPEEIPESSVSILRDVVALRKQSARFFSRIAQKSTNEKLKKSNVTHEFIIKVLENILGRFDAAMAMAFRKPNNPARAPKQSDGQVDVSDLKNMFEHLQVEESQDIDEQDVDVVLEIEKSAAKRSKKSYKKNGKKSGKKKPSKEQHVQKKPQGTTESSWVDEFDWDIFDEDDDDEFDYYMIIYCFFQDFNLIRDYVGDRWWEYFYFKSVPIDNLAVMTNAAYEMFHEMESELEKALKDAPGLADYEFMMNTLFFEYGLDHVDYEGEDELTEEERNGKIFKEADWLGFTVYALVEDILDGVPVGKVPSKCAPDFSIPIRVNYRVFGCPTNTQSCSGQLAGAYAFRRRLPN